MNLSIASVSSHNTIDANNYYIIHQNNSFVSIDKNYLTPNQYKQLVMSVPKIIVSKLKIKLSDECVNEYLNRVDSDQSQVIGNRVSKRLKTKSLNIVSKFSQINVNNDESEQKIGFNVKSIENVSNGKKVVNDLNDTKDEDLLKENKNCSQELSRAIGLPNLGNTCYFNSVIQVLRITPGFAQYVCSLNNSIKTNKNVSKLEEENKQLISSLHSLFVDLGKKLNFETGVHEYIDLKIRSIIESDLYNRRFEFGQQQDSHELLNWLSNELNEYAELLYPEKAVKEMKRFKSDSGHIMKKSTTFLDFHGVMLKNIKCTECNRISASDDSFADIQIPLHCIEDSNDFVDQENMSDLSKSKPTFTEIIHKTDYLKDDNKFECSNCLKKTVASVINSIKISPKILVIVSVKKSCDFRENLRRRKSPKKLFKFPLELEYDGKSFIKYKLYAFIIHDGSTLNNGHYYSIVSAAAVEDQTEVNTKNNCNCNNTIDGDIEWIKINDNKVRKLSDSHVLNLLENDGNSSTPYLAFYKRSDN